ncbi:hypothetical protein BURC_03147 [Burkholderiaceae bacterium]|nr:hypothetical protein BURC_03147 [Burkholderiaceae bacterium]
MNDRVQKKRSGAPLPGAGVRGSATGRPIMALLDLLGRRWALRILWELREGHPETFRALQARMDELSPSILNTRMKELRAAQLVELSADGYALTPLGTRLLGLMLPLDQWAKGWAKALERTPRS